MRVVVVVFVFFVATLQKALAQPLFEKNYADSLHKKRLYTVVGITAGAYSAGISFLSYVWYNDHDRVAFHYYNDRKGYLQMDKWGHAYAAYRESYAAYYALRWAGVDKKKALLYGGPIGLVFQTPIEIFDGMYEGWGFSWYDMAANALGSALFMVQEGVWDNQVIKMKFSYAPSIYPQFHPILGESALESFFADYNGHTYWLSANFNKIVHHTKIPDWLCLSLGYSANGMIYEFDNPTWYRGKPFPPFERYRQYFLSADIDFTHIRTNKKGLIVLFRALNIIKMPLPAVEYNRISKFRFRPVYF